jgi:hypothetical protein
LTTLSRIRAAQPFDTIPVPAIAEPAAPQSVPVVADDAPPESRTLDSRRRDTIPAPPPSGHEADARDDADGNVMPVEEEEPASTERAPFAMEQVG